ncbi:hypothetical protein [Falsiroseomonas sp.]|nr:hypothetical protein [Falsiroseomonas sp.]MDO9498854.1 hypothetical protein [Falsiroseomonas sp.]
MKLIILLFLLATWPAEAQPVAAPPQEDCGCGVPSSPRGPR